MGPDSEDALRAALVATSGRCKDGRGDEIETVVGCEPGPRASVIDTSTGSRPCSGCFGTTERSEDSESLGFGTIETSTGVLSWAVSVSDVVYRFSTNPTW